MLDADAQENGSTVAASSLPELFVSADATAIQAQRSFLRSTALQLSLLVLAAIAGMITVKRGPHALAVGQVLATAAFLAAAVLKAHMATSKPDRTWYQARAAAESIRTLAWRYAMGGQPFPLSLATTDADHSFLDRIHEVLEPLPSLTLVPSVSRIEQITEWMRVTRDGQLRERRMTYRIERIQPEEQWYASRAISNAKYAGRWALLMVTFEVLGAIGALLAGVGIIVFSVAGVAATAVGVITAWMQTRQHQALASAYAVAARELAEIAQLLDESTTEDDWASFVADAEGAISREHTLWTSARSR